MYVRIAFWGFTAFSVGSIAAFVYWGNVEALAAAIIATIGMALFATASDAEEYGDDDWMA